MLQFGADTASLLKIRVDRQTFTDVSDGGSVFILWAMHSEQLTFYRKSVNIYHSTWCNITEYPNL